MRARVRSAGGIDSDVATFGQVSLYALNFDQVLNLLELWKRTRRWASGLAMRKRQLRQTHGVDSIVVGFREIRSLMEFRKPLTGDAPSDSARSRLHVIQPNFYRHFQILDVLYTFPMYRSPINNSVS